MGESSDFKETIRKLAERSRHAQRHALTEEATKTSVILPLIQVLGFDIFDLNEVVPEFVADVGTKKGEKVDFALKIDGKIAMLLEAKSVERNLGEAQHNQLYRYFSTTDARLAILTNGREAWFFSDTGAPNVLDRKPFFIFDLQKEDTVQVQELCKFRRDAFDPDIIPDTAAALKFRRDAVHFLKRQIDTPEDDFMRFLIKQIHDGSATRSAIEQFRPTIQAALDQIVRDRIEERLGVSFAEKAPEAIRASAAATTDAGDGIVTTEEEIEAFRIVPVHALENEGVERIARRQNRDFSRYCLTIQDKVYDNLPKRRLALYVIREAVLRGAKPHEVCEEKWRWLIVAGEHDSQASFLSAAAYDRDSESSDAASERFFTGDDELLQIEGKTFALSSAWAGRQTETQVARIIDRFNLDDVSFLTGQK